jgi:hypothetical protein
LIKAWNSILNKSTTLEFKKDSWNFKSSSLKNKLIYLLKSPQPHGDLSGHMHTATYWYINLSTVQKLLPELRSPGKSRCSLLYAQASGYEQSTSLGIHLYERLWDKEAKGAVPMDGILIISAGRILLMKNTPKPVKGIFEMS